MDLSERRAAPYVVPILFAALLALRLGTGSVIEDNDGSVQVWSGQQVLAGNGYIGWASHSWPPLFGVLVATFSIPFGAVVGGHLVSLLAGAGLLLALHTLALALTGSKRVALLTQALAACLPLVIEGASDVDNHMLDTALFVGCLAVLAQVWRAPSTRGWVLAGFLGGLSAMTRHTSLALLAVGIAVAMLAPHGQRLRPAALFAASLLATALPWFISNTRHAGSPLASWQFINVGMGVASSPMQFRWADQENIHGLLDIVRADPAAFVRNAAGNLVILGWLGVKSMAWTTPAAFIGVWTWFRKAPMQDRVLALGAPAFVSLALCIAFVTANFILPAVAMSTAFSAMAVVRLRDRWSSDAAKERVLRAGQVGLVLLLLGGAVWGGVAVLTTHEAIHGPRGRLVEQDAVTAALRADGAGPDDWVMALHPQRALAVGGSWYTIPGYFVGNASDLVHLRTMGPNVIQRGWNIQQDGADFPPAKMGYLVEDRAAARFLPKTAFLLDPSSPDVPAEFQAILVTPDVVVYRIT